MQAQRLGSVAATRQGPPRHPVQRTHRGRRPDRLRPCLQAWPRRHCLEAQGFRLPFRALPRLAQNEERKCAGREARSRGGLVKGAPEMSVAPPGGQDRIMIYGPKSAGTYIIEFRIADGESLAISVPAGETRVPHALRSGRAGRSVRNFCRAQGFAWWSPPSTHCEVPETPPGQTSPKDEEPGCQLQLLSHANASSSAFVFFRSAVLKPSVNPA